MDKETTQKVALIIAAYLSIAIILIVLFEFNLMPTSSNDNLQFVFTTLNSGLPFILATVSSLAAASIFKTLFKGTLVSAIIGLLLGFALAFGAFFVVTSELITSQIQILGIYIFLMIIAASGYYTLEKILLEYKQISLFALVKFFMVIGIGVIFRFAALDYFPTDLTVEIDIFTCGFFFAAATALFYPFSYAKKAALKKIGDWIGTRSLQKFIIGSVAAAYLFLLRPAFFGMNPNFTLIGEWGFVGVLASAGYFKMRSNLNQISAPMVLENWGKHKQELNFKTTEEFEKLSQNVDLFLQQGKKNGVLLFLFNFLNDRDVSEYLIETALNDLINYQDPPKARLIFSWEAGFAQEERLQKRKQVLEKTIQNLNTDIFRKNW
ncbi:MAG: hypothetical protein NWF05_00930 [Candidatus Bathyarchaeota archaeon]|nr:hypothetical protein [Candidatus Bathyarchaeota archaeon]